MKERIIQILEYGSAFILGVVGMLFLCIADKGM